MDEKKVRNIIRSVLIDNNLMSKGEIDSINKAMSEDLSSSDILMEVSSLYLTHESASDYFALKNHAKGHVSGENQIPLASNDDPGLLSSDLYRVINSIKCEGVLTLTNSRELDSGKGVSPLLRLSRSVSSETTVHTNIGSSILIDLPNNSRDSVTSSQIDFRLTNTTDGSESSDFSISTLVSGTLAERLTINSQGSVSISSGLTAGGVITASGGNSTNWTTAYSTGIAGYSGSLCSKDNREICPSEDSNNRLRFGFGIWVNDDSTETYADYLHLRSYGDSTGGKDNLIMFRRTGGIGMRIWQHDFGSTSPYSNCVDVWTTGDFSSTNVTNWNTAYQWGNHASQGYITDGNTGWNNSYGFITASSSEALTNKSGNISQWTNDSNYLTSQTTHADVVVDGDFTSEGLIKRGDSSGSYTIITDNSSNWDEAHTWGDHSIEGYITDGNTGWNNSYGFITASSSETLTNKSGNISQWSNDSNYLTSQTTHADVVVDGDFTSEGLIKRGESSGSYTIITDNSTNWDEAHTWGDHSIEGYITDGNTGWNNSYGFITASSSETLTNKSGNISQWSNDSNYLTSQTTHADVVVDGDFTSEGLIKRGDSSGSYTIITDNSTNWDTAYTHSQQDHAPSNANAYVLPTATDGALGGVKVGSNLSINASGVLSATNDNTQYLGGAGLTGGTSGGTSIDVGAGNGIEVAADSISVKADDGILVGSGGVKVNSSNGISVVAAGVQVNPHHGISVGGSGVSVNAESNKGLSVGANGVAVSLEANKGLSVGANGVAALVADPISFQSGSIGIADGAIALGKLADISGDSGVLGYRGGTSGGAMTHGKLLLSQHFTPAGTTTKSHAEQASSGPSSTSTDDKTGLQTDQSTTLGSYDHNHGIPNHSHDFDHTHKMGINITVDAKGHVTAVALTDCHSETTEFELFNGNIKLARDLVVGDVLKSKSFSNEGIQTDLSKINGDFSNFDIFSKTYDISVEITSVKKTFSNSIYHLNRKYELTDDHPVLVTRDFSSLSNLVWEWIMVKHIKEGYYLFKEDFEHEEVFAIDYYEILTPIVRLGVEQEDVYFAQGLLHHNK